MYCDFNTYAGLDALIPDYVDALCKEIETFSDSLNKKLPVSTIYFGGGTPSLLTASQVEKILCKIEKRFDLDKDVEISIEANPGTISFESLKSLRGLGVNRLSIGMQSASVDTLARLGRRHSYKQVCCAVDDARRAGFSNLGLDLIFGIPMQSFSEWQSTLRMATSLEPEHLSLYCLSIEENTPLEKMIKQGLYSEPDIDLGADMYEWACDELERVGYYQYEISNWAKCNIKENEISYVCRHNLQYWHNMPYIGVGAGAHGFINGVRTVNVTSPHAYIKCLNNPPLRSFPCTPATEEVISVDRKTEMNETMLMGLRLTNEGVGDNIFSQRFGNTLVEVFGSRLETLVVQGLLEWIIVDRNEKRLRLTKRGKILGNQVFLWFV